VTKQIFGMLLGWALLTIGCWFLSLSIVGYVIGDINPLHWNAFQRGKPLFLQGVFICLFIAATHRQRRG
jgi:hypothetical protein